MLIPSRSLKGGKCKRVMSMHCGEIERRIERLRKMAEEYNIDAFFITSEPNIRYFSGFSTFAIERLIALIIPTASHVEPILIVPKLEVEKARNLSFFKKNIRDYDDVDDPTWIISKVMKELKLTEGVLGVEGSLPIRFYRLIKKAIPSLKVREASIVFERLRSIKSMEEIEIMQKAADIVIKGIKAGIEAIKTGISEISIAFEIKREIIELGGEIIPFCLVLSGENSALPHGNTSSKRIRKGDTVIIDVGAAYKGYYADVTRTIFIGEINEKQKEIYNIVLRAQENAINSVKPWIKACQVDMAARSFIKEAGYDAFFVHRTGHGLGLEVHEEPYITQTNKTLLKPRMVFTIEPGIYIPNSFGIRIEDDILVTEYGKEVLTKMSKDLLII